MAKSKSLLNQTSKKKEDKYREISDIKKEYKFDVGNTVIYLGLLNEYKGAKCEINKKSRRKNMEHYKVKFEDGEIADTSVGFLKTPEEHEEYLLEQENNNEDINDDNMSEFELELISKGIRSHKNHKACLSPLDYYHRECTGTCTYKDKCVYRNKSKYKKLDNN